MIVVHETSSERAERRLVRCTVKESGSFTDVYDHTERVVLHCGVPGDGSVKVRTMQLQENYTMIRISSPPTAAMAFDDDHTLAMQIAHDAGCLLMALKDNAVLSNSPLGDAADAVAQQFIDRALRHHRPHDAILSEEAPPDLRRLRHSRVWIVDPLDGTREYSEPGNRSDWAVHVALCTDGVPAAGAVALPAQGMTYHTGNVARPAIGQDRELRIVVSRTRPTAFAASVAAGLGAELIMMGSAGAKAMAIVRGDADAYLATGEMAEWDSAAPVAVSTAAGLHVSRIDGTPLAFNQALPRTPDLLICRLDLAPMLLAAIAAVHRQP